MATYSGGAGTSASPYQIKTKEDLNTLAATSEDWTKYFILMKDVAFTAASTKTIGNGGPQESGRRWVQWRITRDAADTCAEDVLLLAVVIEYGTDGYSDA